jgi:Na+/phosphate symporter
MNEKRREDKAMKEQHVFFNPFRMLSPKLNEEAERLEKMHDVPVQQSVSLEEGLLVMISKLIEMNRLLSKSVFPGSRDLMDRCAALAKEVHYQEKVLTRELLTSGLKGEVMKGLIRFPYRLERMGDMLESILGCCRIRARDDIPFSDRAHAELDQLFSILDEMMINLRDAFRLPNKVLLQAILAQSNTLAELLEEFKLAHWERLEGGYCAIEASSIYREILDSAKSVNEYIAKMSSTLLELGEAGPIEKVQQEVT